MGAGAVGKNSVEQERAEDAPATVPMASEDADVMHQQDATDDGAEVIDERRDGLHVKLLADKEHGPENSPAKKN